MSRGRARWPGFGAPGWLFAGALATSAFVWATVAWPVLSGGLGAHAGHAAGVYLHALTGSVMLVSGALALHVGWTRRWFRRHRLFGYLYLGSGTGASLAALALNVADPHRDAAVGVATSVLALTWLGIAAMALRAARNRRLDQHREWVIRSYVLTWTFVFCRLVMRTPAAAMLGEAGVATVIWTTWIVPLLVCEAVLQWRRGSRVTVLRKRSESPGSGVA